MANLLVALLPKDPAICSAKYLYHLLMAKKDEYLVPLMLGTANVSLKERDIAGVEISLPPLDEQRRIVFRIEGMTARAEQAKKLQGEIRREQRRLLLGAYTRVIEGAKWSPMSEVAPLVRRPVKVEPLEEYKELGIRSFGKGTFHKAPISGATLGSKKVFRIEPGDLLFNIVFAWEGAVAVAQAEDQGRIGSHRFLTCVPRDGVVTSAFLCFHFLTERGLEDIGTASPGGAGRNRTLGLEALARIEVPVPPIDKQSWLGSVLAKTNEADHQRDKVTAELDALMPSILSKAFRGLASPPEGPDSSRAGKTKNENPKRFGFRSIR